MQKSSAFTTFTFPDCPMQQFSCHLRAMMREEKLGRRGAGQQIAETAIGKMDRTSIAARYSSHSSVVIASPKFDKIARSSSIDNPLPSCHRLVSEPVLCRSEQPGAHQNGLLDLLHSLLTLSNTAIALVMSSCVTGGLARRADRGGMRSGSLAIPSPLGSACLVASFTSEKEGLLRTWPPSQTDAFNRTISVIATTRHEGRGYVQVGPLVCAHTNAHAQ